MRSLYSILLVILTAINCIDFKKIEQQPETFKIQAGDSTESINNKKTNSVTPKKHDLKPHEMEESCVNTEKVSNNKCRRSLKTGKNRCQRKKGKTGIIDTIVSKNKSNKSEEWTDNNRIPPTLKDAELLAQEINSYARRFIKSRYDTLYYLAERGISLFENASLFYLKGYACLKLGRYSEAVNALEVAIAKDDFWNKEDKKKTFQIRLDTYIKLEKIFPSRKIRENSKIARTDYENNN